MLLFSNVFRGLRLGFLIMSCNSFNVQAPTLKPNPQTLVHVPYNTHCQTLTNLQSEKMCSKLANCKKKFVNLFTKTPISKLPNQHHTRSFFWVKQACTTIHLDTLLHTPHYLKPTQNSYKAFWNYPLHRSLKSPLNNKGHNSKQ